MSTDDERSEQSDPPPSPPADGARMVKRVRMPPWASALWQLMLLPPLQCRTACLSPCPPAASASTGPPGGARSARGIDDALLSAAALGLATTSGAPTGSPVGTTLATISSRPSCVHAPSSETDGALIGTYMAAVTPAP